ncbi:MAG: hypothetical protein N2512_12865, partial [Armatimonadetes bacterium]|nr:hypothetical protein [Armatimonadota bacterium]
MSMCGTLIAWFRRRMEIGLVLGSLALAWCCLCSQQAAAAENSAAPTATEDFSSLGHVLPRDPASALNITPRLGTTPLAVQSGARVAGTALKWTLTGSVDAIALTKAVYKPPGTVTLWVKNPRGSPVTLQLLAVAIPGGVSQWPAQDISGCKNWTRLTWQPEDAAPVGQEGQEQLPLRSQPYAFLPVCEWRIVAAKAKGSGPAEIYLDEFCVEPASERRLVVHSIRPAAWQIRAGGIVTAEVELEDAAGATVFDKPRLCLTQSGGRIVAWQYLAAAGPAEGRHNLSVELAVPASAAPGDYELQVTAAAAQVDGPAAKGVTVNVVGPASPPSPPVTQLPKAIADLTGRRTTDWRLSPTRVYFVPACANFDAHGLSPDVALPDGQRCWDGLDEMLNAVVQHDPEGMAVLQVFVGVTPAWLAAHPDDCAKFLPETQDFAASPRLRRLPSFSSAAWRQRAAADLADLVRHVEASPWAGLILGYVICAGDGTWAMPASRGTPLPDYSAAAVSDFRAWLRGKYQTLPDLRTAWGQARHPVLELLKDLPPDEPRPVMAWDDATLPKPERRLTAPTALLEPPMFQDVVDSALFMADQSAAAAAELVRGAKQHTRLPVGILYGGWLADSQDPVRLATGHLALGKLLRSPDVDFLVFQGQVTCVGWLAPFASIQFHHKPWLVQITSTKENPDEEPRDKIALAFAAGAHGVSAPAGSSQMAAVWKAIQEGGICLLYTS